jgi:hypothetical protein
MSGSLPPQQNGGAANGLVLEGGLADEVTASALDQTEYRTWSGWGPGDRDDRGAAEGIITGSLLGLLFWMGIAFAVWLI